LEPFVGAIGIPRRAPLTIATIAWATLHFCTIAWATLHFSTDHRSCCGFGTLCHCLQSRIDGGGAGTIGASGSAPVRELSVLDVQQILKDILPETAPETAPEYHPEASAFGMVEWGRSEAVSLVAKYVASEPDSQGANWDGREKKALAATFAAPGCGKTHFLSMLLRLFDDRAIFVGFNSSTTLLVWKQPLGNGTDCCNDANRVAHEETRGGVVPCAVRILWYSVGRLRSMEFENFALAFYTKLQERRISLETALNAVSTKGQLILLIDEIRKLDDTAIRELLQSGKQLLDKRGKRFRLVVSTLDWEPVWNACVDPQSSNTGSNRKIHWLPLPPLIGTETESWFLTRRTASPDQERIMRFFLALCNGHPRTLAECASVLPESSDWSGFGVDAGIKSLQEQVKGWASIPEPTAEQTNGVLYFVAASVLNMPTPLKELHDGVSLSSLIHGGFAINGQSDLDEKTAVPVFSPILLRYWCERRAKSRVSPLTARVCEALVALVYDAGQSDGESYEFFNARFQLLRRWAHRIVYPEQDRCTVDEWYKQCTVLKRGKTDVQVEIPQLTHRKLLVMPTLREPLANGSPAIDVFGCELDLSEHVLVKTSHRQPGFDNLQHNDGNLILEENKFSEIGVTTTVGAPDVAHKLGLCKGFNRDNVVWVLLGPRHSRPQFNRRVLAKQAFKQFAGTVVALVGDRAKEWYGPTFSQCAAFWIKAAELRG